MTLPFSGVTRAAYEAALSMSTDTQVVVDVLTLDHVPVSSVVAKAVDGNVTIVPDADIDRTLQIDFDDPDHQLQIDSDSPTDGALGFDRLIQVKHMLWTPGLPGGGGWLTVPVFTGVPVVPERNGSTISIEAHDKAIRCIAPREVGHYTIPKGHQVVSAIRDLLKRCGETKFAFPADTKTKVTKNTPVGGADETKAPWPVARALAKAHGYQLFYDTEGRATLRKTSTEPVTTWFADLPSSTVTDVVTTKLDFTTLRNRVRVTGKKGVHAYAELPASHPYSPESLASGGVRCVLTTWYDDSNIGSTTHARAVAKRELGKYQMENIQVQFPCVPVYHLDPLDACRIETESWGQTFRLREATIPLGAGDMSVGYQQDVSTPAAASIRPVA